MLENRESSMWQIGDISNVTGKTAFDHAKTDPTARAVVDRYIEMLGVGIVNLANEFRPEAIMLGGGVCAQGDALLVPLEEYVNKEIFAGDMGPRVKILKAQLENNAGVLGAVSLLLDD
jgi:glucokinase